MAGAGYKLFNTGDVLTAAQVNTYLQEQTVMVFADATARTTALSGVLAEGMVTYLKDTNAIEKYTGAAWVNIDSGSTSPLTTKGDLYTYSTTDARLAVGNNGETLVADSSATTGLRWQGNFAAGKNKIINGDMNIWQRGTSTTLTNNTFGFGPDRFRAYVTFSAGTSTFAQQSFTAGTAPVAGYESQYFARITCGSTTTYAEVSQRIEDVRTLAGQTATVSFWAKSSASLTFTPYLIQSFGTGGSSDVLTAGSNITLTSSWVRYTATVSVPSISGKTIGANNTLIWALTHVSGTLNSATIDIWGVQVEAGNTATAFQTATGTLAGELAACQRYYYLHASGAGLSVCNGGYYSATQLNGMIHFPVTMRTAPVLVSSTGTDYYISERNGGFDTFNSLTIFRPNETVAMVYNNTEATGTAGHATLIYTNNASASIAFNSEL